MLRKMSPGRAASFILMIVLVVLALGATAKPAHAICCGFDFTTIYYSDCPAKQHQVGDCEIDCTGTRTCEGMQTTCHTTFKTCCSC